MAIDEGDSPELARLQLEGHKMLLERELAELRGELEQEHEEAERRRLALLAAVEGKAPKQKRRSPRKKARDKAEPPASRSAGGRAVSAANRSLDGSVALPPYELVREDGSRVRVDGDDPDVGPGARR